MGTGLNIMNLSFFSQPLLSDFPNDLAGREPTRRVFAFRPVVLALLLAACFLPRAWMCVKMEGIYADGALYIGSAKLLEEGNIFAGDRKSVV